MGQVRLQWLLLRLAQYKPPEVWPLLWKGDMQLSMLGNHVTVVGKAGGLCDHEHDVSFHWGTGRNEPTWDGPHNRSETQKQISSHLYHTMERLVLLFPIFQVGLIEVRGGVGTEYRRHNMFSLAEYELLYFIIFINFFVKGKYEN